MLGYSILDPEGQPPSMCFYFFAGRPYIFFICGGGQPKNDICRGVEEKIKLCGGGRQFFQFRPLSSRIACTSVYVMFTAVVHSMLQSEFDSIPILCTFLYLSLFSRQAPGKCNFQRNATEMSLCYAKRTLIS